MRKIIHIDMDAFFASVEQYDYPELLGKPVVVGGMNVRDVIAAASYEARKYGVRSAMSSVKALKLCPHLIFVPHRFKRYKEISLQIRAIFYEYTDLVEPLSLDEAYLDVTENKKGIQSAIEIASEIRKKIYEKTGLTASAGISINKFLAKIASDVHKPNGQKLIHPTQILDFLKILPIEKFYGIGKVTADRMKKLGIFTGAELHSWTIEALTKEFKNSGYHYYQIARGIDDSIVKSERARKSISTEVTFQEDIIHISLLEEKLFEVVRDLNQRLKAQNVKGKTLTLKLKFKDFSVINRSRTYGTYFNDFKKLYQEAKLMLEEHFPKQYVRLIGFGMSNFEKKDKKIHYKTKQLELPFEEYI